MKLSPSNPRSGPEMDFETPPRMRLYFTEPSSVMSRYISRDRHSPTYRVFSGGTGVPHPERKMDTAKTASNTMQRFWFITLAFLSIVAVTAPLRLSYPAIGEKAMIGAASIAPLR